MAAKEPDAPRRPHRLKGFYEAAMTQAERLLLSEARLIEGLDEEIALLRVKLIRALAEHPDNTELVLKGVGMLVRAVATRYRLSPRAKENLAEAISEVLKEIGTVLAPNLQAEG